MHYLSIFVLKIILRKLINSSIFFGFAGSVLDSGNSFTSGRHASLLAATTSRGQPGLAGNGIGEQTQVNQDLA